MHERAIALTVFDQIPVSENQEIKVDLNSKIAPTKQNVDDKRGVLVLGKQARARPGAGDRVWLPRVVAGGEIRRLRALTAVRPADNHFRSRRLCARKDNGWPLPSRALNVGKGLWPWLQ